MSVNAKDLTTKTTPSANDAMLLFDATSNQGSNISFANLAASILKPKTATLSTQNGAIVYGENTSVKQIGDLVVINLSLRDIPAGSTETEVCRFTGVDAPSKNLRGICGVGANLYDAYNTAYLFVTQDNKILIRKPSSAQSYPCAVIHFSYIV